MEQGQAKTLVSRLLSAFPGRDPSVATAALFVEYLGRYSVDVGERAVRRVIELERFLPTLSELLDYLGEANDWHRHQEGLARPALTGGEDDPPTEMERAAVARMLRETRERLTEQRRTEAQAGVQTSAPEPEDCPVCGELMVEGRLRHAEHCLPRSQAEDAALEAPIAEPVEERAEATA